MLLLWRTHAALAVPMADPITVKHAAIPLDVTVFIAAASILLAVVLLLGGLAFFHLLRRLDLQWSTTVQVFRLMFAPDRQGGGPTRSDHPPSNRDIFDSDHNLAATAPSSPSSGKDNLASPTMPGADSADRESAGVNGSGTAAAGVPVHGLPRLIFARKLLPVIHDYVTDFLRTHGEDQEACGMLVGNYSIEDSTGVSTFTINGFIEAGPNVDFSAGSILFDDEYQSQMLQALQLEHPSVGNMGCVHRHNGFYDECSSGDESSDRESVENADTKALVFAIITLNNSRRRPSSILYDDFKIDFFVMSEQTDFKYVPVLPVLADLPVLTISPAIIALSTARGRSASYDLAVLRRLPGLARTTISAMESTDGSSVLISVSLKEIRDRIHIILQNQNALRLVLEAEDGSKHECRGIWEHYEAGQHIWISHLVLLAQILLSRTHQPPHYGRHYSGLLDDKYRLVAEVRAMQEKYGDLAVLRRRGDMVYWEYVVRESNRSFPIEIRYPNTYPADPPQIVSIRNLPSSPHQIVGNELCWIDHFTQHSEWNPSRDTAVICISAAHRWFACLLVYLTLGTWPEGADL